MKVKLASTAGFCMGVRRAMELVLVAANHTEEPIYTFGPLIHNRQVMDLLEKKGVLPVDDLEGLSRGSIVIRAHGIPPEQRRILKGSGLRIIDGTCPRVARVQAIIRYHTRQGLTAVIVGDHEHPEVVGLMGYSSGPAYVIESAGDAAGLPEGRRFFVVAQTTQDEKVYEEITRAICKRFPETHVFDTICDATHQRQEEVRILSACVDAMVVVGGYHSGNTRRLVQISRSAGLPTCHVETERDLDSERFSGMDVIGVTAGASTPNWMIKNVVKKIEGICSPRHDASVAWVRKVLKFLLLSNLVVASGAASLSYAAFVLAGDVPVLSYPVLAFLYVYAMHVLNRFLDKGASAYNDPERAAFYKAHAFLLRLTGLAAVSAALVLAYGLGRETFLALAGFSILGLLYSLPLVPAKHRKKYPYAKIKDIPGSKTLAEALAWVAVISVLPRLNGHLGSLAVLLTTSSLIFLLSYVRSGLFDMLQLQGDLIVGKETLPVTLGLRKASFVIKGALLLTGLILSLAPLLNWIEPLSYPLLVCVAGLYLCVMAYERQWTYPGLAFEALVECNFWAMGFLAVIWHYILILWSA